MYNLSDILIDVSCTLTCFCFCWPSLFVSYGQTAKVIVKENVLRSICIVVINSYLMYSGTTTISAFTSFFIYWLQALVYCVACNSEFFWKAERNRVHELVRANPESGKRVSEGNRTFKRDSLSVGGKSGGGGGSKRGDSVVGDVLRANSVRVESRRESGFK
ncbi:hypothetical protein HDU98_004727 [Podochytrium sp. JEL0797]|nr:hypothetical protein HDU98_004727 [Podochytrium sp. JEL0797]